MASPHPGTSSNFTKLGLVLLTLLGVLFFIFMGAAAFFPSLFATPVVAGGIVTWWFAFAFGLIWTSVFATGVYVFIVNMSERNQ